MLEEFETGREGRQGRRQEVDQAVGSPTRSRRSTTSPSASTARPPNLADARGSLPLPVPDHGPGRRRQVRRRLERHGRLRAGRARCRPPRRVHRPQGRLLGRRAVGRPLRVHRHRRGRGGRRVAPWPPSRSTWSTRARSPRCPRWRRCRTSRCSRSTRPTPPSRASHSVKPFDDKRVRQALRYATDTEATLKAAHRGLGHARRPSPRLAGPPGIRPGHRA